MQQRFAERDFCLLLILKLFILFMDDQVCLNTSAPAVYACVLCDWHCIYFFTPGDGKTHFVRRILQDRVEYPSVTITVNEGFSTTGAILELTSLPEDAKRPIVFFNFTFTLLPPDYKVCMPVQQLFHTVLLRWLLHFLQGCEPKEKEKYKILIDSISWFFFDLLVLGYVEDRDSGLSFRLPGDLSWTIYVEVRLTSKLN